MNRLFSIVQRIEEFILASSIILIAALTILNVFARSLFNYSLSFTEELGQFLIIFVTFVGLSYAASKGRHIRMTAIYDQMGDKARKTIMILIASTTALLLFYLAYHAVDYALTIRRLGSVSPVLQVPLYLIYLVAPLGLVLAGVQYVFTVVRNLRETDVFLSYDTKDEYREREPVSGEI